MFTGIVEETGEIADRSRDGDGLRLRIAADAVAEGLAQGQSISVSGACLTVERFEAGAWFEVFLAEETLERTYLGELTPGDRVNLERAMPADGRFDGHVVQGHVDGVATLESVFAIGADGERVDPGAFDQSPPGGWVFGFDLPGDLARYVVEKGSIALDGISLTVAGREGSTVDVAIVPSTYAVTTLAEKAPGDPVHVEVDVLAKYVERLLETVGDGPIEVDSTFRR